MQHTPYELENQIKEFLKNITEDLTIASAHENIIDIARSLHVSEQKITRASLMIVAFFERTRTHLQFRMSQEDFARKIGLTPNMYWKRAQAEKLLRFHPEFEDLFSSGDLTLSHLALMTPKITQANKEQILDFAVGKSTRELKVFLSTINLDGTFKEDSESLVELKLNFTPSMMKKLQRAKEVLAKNGEIPSDEQVFEEAMDFLLRRRDPIQKAERSIQRQKHSERESIPSTDTHTSSPALPSAKKENKTRPAIPAFIKHQIVQRDKGMCQHRFQDGSLCGSKIFLEFDHLVPWSYTKNHNSENIVLKCRRHNQHSAFLFFGEEHMNRFINVSKDPRKNLNYSS